MGNLEAASQEFQKIESRSLKDWIVFTEFLFDVKKDDEARIGKSLYKDWKYAYDVR